MSKILVTGGAGFIGSHVAKKLLEKGDEVVIVDNFNSYYSPKLKEARIERLLKGFPVKVYRADISNFEALELVFAEHKFDKICHLAAQAGVRYSIEKPEAYGFSNLTGTLNLLRLAEKYKVKNFVFASSSSVYGLNKEFPSREEHKVVTPISLYAATKIAGEGLVHVYAKTHGLKTICLRFFNVYGPWMRPDMALFKFTQRMYAGKPIDVYNYGKSRKDYTYIDDIVTGVVNALDKAFEYEIINLGNSNPILLTEYISHIESNLGTKAEKNMLPAIAGDVQESCAHIGKAKDMLGYNPQIKVEEGIKKFVDWYKEYADILGLHEI